MNKKKVDRVALITGANRGIGFELCRQLAQKGIRVVLTARNAQKGEAAALTLKKEDLDVEFHQLDLIDPASIDQTYDWLLKTYNRLDYLVNNAGILADAQRHPADEVGASIFNTSIDKIRKSMEVNCYGPILTSRKFIPLMKQNAFGRIINVSSGMGQLSEMDGGWPGYRISKTSLNAVTRILASELSESGITVVSICPGWVKTDMGGKKAELEVPEAVKSIVKTLLNNHETGIFLRHGKRIDW